MSEPLVYRLKQPVQVTETRLLEELRFRTDLTVEDLEKLDQVDASGVGVKIVAQLAAIMSDEPLVFIRAMKAVDYAGVAKIVRPFLVEFLATGESS